MSKSLGGALAGLALRALGHDPYGRKTDIPALPTIDPGQLQQQNLLGNQKLLPQAQALASSVNAFNADQLRAVLGKLAPGQLEQVESVIRSQLRGELSPDTQAQIADFSAAQAAGLGVAGSPFQAGIASLRGAETALGLQQRGIQNFQALAALRPPQFDVSSMFFTAPQRLEFALRDRAARFQRDLLSAQVAAAPNPADIALAEGFDNFMGTWAGIGANYLGQVLGNRSSSGSGQTSGHANAPINEEYYG